MGMRIGNATQTGASQTAGVSNWQQRQQGASNLFSALQSGDLKAAQASYAGLSGTAGGVNPNSSLGQIGQALQSGDLAGAQKLAQSMRSSHSGQHHHAPTASASAPSATPGSGALLDVVA